MGLAREAQAVFYTLHPMFTLNSLLVIFDVIPQQDFLYKNGHGSGVGERKGGAHILLRGRYAVPFIHRNTNRAFFF